MSAYARIDNAGARESVFGRRRQINALSDANGKEILEPLPNSILISNACPTLMMQASFTNDHQT